MGGGAESLLTTIVNHLNPLKYKISIIEIVHSNVKIEPVNDNIEILPYMMEADDSDRKTKMYSFYHEWDKVIEKYIPHGYDLYVSFNMQRPSFLLPPCGKNIAWIHSDLFFLANEDKKEEYQLQAQAFDKCKKIVAISDITSQSIHQLFPEYNDRIVDLYNGVDVNLVKQKSQEQHNLFINHPALLYCGRLEERKQPKKAIDWLKELHKKGITAHLYYMGYGPLQDETKIYAEECQLDKYVHFLGYYENPFPIMKEMDVTLMPSRWEGFPMNLLESVSLGVPFVSNLIGGATPLSCNGTVGKIVETSEEAADAIVSFINMNSQERISRCENAIRNYDVNNYTEQIQKLFDEVINGK